MYSEEYVYDAGYQQIQGIKDPENDITTVDYINGKVSGVTDPEAELHSYQYNTGVTEITTNREKTVAFEYNAAGSIIQKTDPLGYSINYEYDSNYNVTRMYYVNKINGVDTIINHYYNKVSLILFFYYRRELPIYALLNFITTHPSIRQLALQSRYSASLLYTTDHNNVKRQEHILDPGGSIVASKRFDGAYENMYFFYNYDIRGSVTNIIKPDGTRVKGYEYDEFGNTKEVGESQFKNDVKFTGAVHDTSTGLYYMNARFYNPSSGRFLSQDSYSGNPQDPWTQHLYAYCGNNPINMIDPTGHFAIPLIFIAIPILIGALTLLTYSTTPDGQKNLDNLWRKTTEVARNVSNGFESIYDKAEAKVSNVVQSEKAKVKSTATAIKSKVNTKVKSIEKKLSSDYTVYKLVNPDTEIPEYVGRTKSPREREMTHKRDP
ncbi:MAG: RHS repeat-associated core domain-containing protein, partial [Clostridia bacterium]|nr:RHS repeat-associated core domain-containing protein [Clostridia bacterium]